MGVALDVGDTSSVPFDAVPYIYPNGDRVVAAVEVGGAVLDIHDSASDTSKSDTSDQFASDHASRGSNPPTSRPPPPPCARTVGPDPVDRLGEHTAHTVPHKAKREAMMAVEPHAETTEEAASSAVREGQCSAKGSGSGDGDAEVDADAEQRRQAFLMKFWFKAMKARAANVPAGDEAEAGTKQEAGIGASTTTAPAPTENGAEASRALESHLTSAVPRDENGQAMWRSREFVRERARQFRTYGVQCFRGVFEPEQVAQWKQRLDEQFHGLLAYARDTLHMEDAVKTRELVCRSPRRYDMTDAQDPDFFREIHRHAPWSSFLRAVLGVDCKLIRAGCVVALPNAPTQAVHRDGKFLFGSTEHIEDIADDANAEEDDARDVPFPLPPHCVHVFVPLIDLSPELGPTRFYPRTHNFRVPSTTVPNSQQETSDGDADEEDENEVAAIDWDGHHFPAIDFASATAGSAIVFSYTVLHQGRANKSPDLDRPVLYFTYARSWFVDQTNYPDNVSLFADGDADAPPAPP